MVTKHNRAAWRSKPRGEHHDSRHFDSGFEYSGWNGRNSDNTDPDSAPSFVVWIVSGLVVVVLVAAAIQELVLPALDDLKGRV